MQYLSKTRRKPREREKERDSSSRKNEGENERAKAKNVKEQKRMTLSATDGTKVVGLARINSFRAFQHGGWIARETEGLEERLWILRPSERAGKKESRAKGRGTGRANRLSSRGLRELRPGITPVAFSSLPLPFFPLFAAYPSFATLIRLSCSSL